MAYIKRSLSGFLKETLDSRPLVYLNGPRQVGKSTLVQNFNPEKETNYVSFDSPLTLAAARSDVAGFMRSLPEDKLNILDEVQMAPEIYPYLKISVDERRQKNQNRAMYLLTGSANLMALPGLSKALVGRMSVLTLLPFSSAEIRNHDGNFDAGNFVEKLYREDPVYRRCESGNLLDMIGCSTFPEPALFPNLNRTQWFDDYVTTLLQRDVLALNDIRNPVKIITLLSVLATRAGALLNNSQAAVDSSLDSKTYERYKGAAINSFMIFEMPAWAKPSRLNKRFTKAAKLFFYDTNLLAYLMRRDIGEIFRNDRTTMGHLFENYVAAEIMKHLSSLPGYGVFHFRTADKKELDFVIERNNGEILGIEVKLSDSLTDRDFSGLKILREAVGEQFRRGFVIYSGKEILPWGKDLWALPVSCLWDY
jgi:predicted AAA+ superfamily ATPase